MKQLCMINAPSNKNNMRFLVHVHVYYPELWYELREALGVLQNYSWDLWVTMVENHEDIVHDVRRFKHDAHIQIVENRGYDVAPFLHVLQQTDLDQYDLCIKLHTKRDFIPDSRMQEFHSLRVPYKRKGAHWRNALLTPFRESHFRKIITAFQSDDDLGMVGDHRFIIHHAGNPAEQEVIEGAREILQKLNLPHKNLQWISGTMFVCRAELLKPMLELNLKMESFSVPDTEHTLSLPHMVEVALGGVIEGQAFKVKDVYTPVWLQAWRFIWAFLFLFIHRIIFRVHTDDINKYKICKTFYGKYHPRTVWARCLRYPYLMPYFLFCVPYYIYRYMKQNSKQRKRGAVHNCVKKRFHEIAKITPDIRVSEVIKPLALYLPQFHQIPENDEWWGQGFTEWTNVRKAEPIYTDHYQPHVPHADVGYYDLSDVDVMRRQAKMAKEYGLYGFCFYYYHFANGKRLLEKPVNNWLKATDIDFPFCFAWANENWTRTWDGGDKEIIMPQDYDEDNMIQMLRDMIPAFKDKRYIKIDGKPVLFVYRAEIVPEIKSLTKKWREVVRVNGFDDIVLVSMQHFSDKNPFKMGFDAAAEFAPGNTPFSLPVSTEYYVQHYEQMFRHVFFDMNDVISWSSEATDRPYPCIRCVAPSWDNAARRGKTCAMVVYNSSPSQFKRYYTEKIRETANAGYPMNGMLLINAWNEWAEGAHLEPDEKYGYQYLEVIRDIGSRSLMEIDHMK